MQSSRKTDRTHEARVIFDELDMRWLESALDPLPSDPVAILDIDSTIMDTASRNRGILEASRKLFPQVESIIPTLTDADLGWAAAATVAARARLSATQERRLQDFWAERFFSNQWLSCDHPYPGVRTFLFWLRDRGFHLVYLTGRDEPNMSDGTITSFERHSLPVDEGTRFFFKPDPSDDDIVFKQSALESIAAIGTPVLAVDNEPGNANTFRGAFPDALVLWMDTITSPDPEPLANDIHVFRRYPSAPCYYGT